MNNNRHHNNLVRLLCISLFPLFTFSFYNLQSQEVVYREDVECGCELVFVDGIQTTSDGELFGFRREDGTVISENRFRYVDQFHGDYCKVYLDERQCGLIDRDGREVVPCIYDDVMYPSEGRILVIKDYLFGYCDMQGNEVIPRSYRQAGDFSEGLAPIFVLVDSNFGACTFIDTTGRQVFPPIFENLQPFNEGYAFARRYERWGMIDHQGREVLPYMYEYISLNDNGYFFAGDSAGMAMFDYTMKPLTDFVYTWTGGMNEGFIMVKREGHYGFLDRHGREVIPCRYDEISPFRMGRAMVVLNGRYGIIDTAGNTVLPIEYENKTPHGRKYVFLEDSLALVEKDGRLGFVDLDGQLVIPMYFTEAYHFTQGLAAAKFNGQWGYINTRGEIYMPFIFQLTTPFRWGRAEVVYEGNVSEVDLRGKCTKNCNGIIAWRDWNE